MSIHAIHEYHRKVENIIHFGGTKKETAIRNAFQHLLDDYAHQKGLMLIPEISMRTTDGKTVTPDGTLKDSLRQAWGYWESKDEADDIDEEIAKKFAKGYPKDNIIFEDSATAVLYQHGTEVRRVSMKDEQALDKLILAFMNYERPEVKGFREAIAHFKEDIPHVTQALREIIEAQEDNTAFTKRRAEFLELCKEAINPEVSAEDVKEMMIQHILTSDIFNTIFDEPHFHRENNVAKELEEVVNTFFTRAIRQQTLNRIKHYYDTINATAAGIADHHEKQKFLKVVYETFYKSYNPKAADRLGVVYTPNEIVRFMIESTDYLLHKHFGKFLEDKGVEILDPATGTGTFICDIIDHIGKNKLEYKYKNELHANEVAILPYYISNLNIEFTYKQKMGQYAEFEHLCFMDTLDNLEFKNLGRTQDMFNLSEENSKRILRQNSKKMMVVIGNPPYNANQQNENDNNKNREYPQIDKRIKETFIHHSTAQKTKVYDMYARFYRWAFDRINEKGMIAFVTNRSFIDSRTFDGFRKTIQDEFDFAYIIDTKSDVRANPKIAGTTHNVFCIQTGVAIMLLVKLETKNRKKSKNCNIQYVALDDFWKKEQKLQWFAEHQIKDIPFEHVTPDKNSNWIALSEDNDWEKLIPIENPDNSTKQLFSFLTNGVNTARDEWVFDYAPGHLIKKINYLAITFNKQVDSERYSDSDLDYSIKWSDNLKSELKKRLHLVTSSNKIRRYNYRPFFKQWYYSDKRLSDRLTAKHYKMFGRDLNISNSTITFSGKSSSKPFSCLAVAKPFSFDFLEKTQCVSLITFDEKDVTTDNITDWGVKQFWDHYFYNKKKIPGLVERYFESYLKIHDMEFNPDATYSEMPMMQKHDIFHYVYGVLHNPAYRQKYALNLKRDFPRIPFYENFWEWAEWGRKLMDLHINYEKAEPYPLQILLTEPKPGTANKAKLKADKEAGTITLDMCNAVAGIPTEAWEYKLGNRSALEWILDQYRESTPKDPTIAEKFNTYRFADYIDHVTDLILRVTTVSVETMKIVGAMKEGKTENQ